jgi:2'-5' RNA ligase
VKNLRTFVAVDVSDAVRRYADSLKDELAACLTGIHWTRRENLHLTLKFLGDVPETELAGVCRAVRLAVADQDPLEIECACLGAFPSQDRPRTLWIGIREGEERLRILQGQIDEKLTQHGFPPERRRFHGHLTIGRISRRDELNADQLARVKEIIEREQAAGGVVMMVNEVVTFSSFLNPEGRVYQPIDHARLGTI